MVVPVFALALGANALVKARPGVERRQLQTVLGGIGMTLGALATLSILLGTYGG